MGEEILVAVLAVSVPTGNIDRYSFLFLVGLSVMHSFIYTRGSTRIEEYSE